MTETESLENLRHIVCNMHQNAVEHPGNAWYTGYKDACEFMLKVIDGHIGCIREQKLNQNTLDWDMCRTSMRQMWLNGILSTEEIGELLSAIDRNQYPKQK